MLCINNVGEGIHYLFIIIWSFAKWIKLSYDNKWERLSNKVTADCWDDHYKARRDQFCRSDIIIKMTQIMLKFHTDERNFWFPCLVTSQSSSARSVECFIQVNWTLDTINSNPSNLSRIVQSLLCVSWLCVGDGVVVEYHSAAGDCDVDVTITEVNQLVLDPPQYQLDSRTVKTTYHTPVRETRTLLKLPRQL